MQYHYTYLIVLLALVMALTDKSAAQHSVVYVDSYHQGYAWSDGIYRAINNELDKADIHLTVIRLDSKRHPDKPFIRDAAAMAYETILSIKPDIIIASDDNASRYLVMPYFKNSTYPVIFCGINWDAGIYGYPYPNTTGMIEVADIKRLIRYLENFTPKKDIAYLAADVLTARKEGLYYSITLNRDIRNVFVSRFKQWVASYKQLQKEYDIMIIGNCSGINDWNDEEARACVMQYTQKPTGTSYEFMCPYALIGYVKDPEEQGRWAAKTALKVLGGTPVSDIPITQNRQFRLIVNKRVARSSGLSLPDTILMQADKTID